MTIQAGDNEQSGNQHQGARHEPNDQQGDEQRPRKPRLSAKDEALIRARTIALYE